MKQTLKALTLPFLTAAVLFSTGALSAPAPADKPLPPQWQQGNVRPPFPGPDGHPMPKPGFCHGGELFCATSASDNPTDTINKLTAVIPTSQAKHYEVRVSVVALPDNPSLR
ncbi:TPA: hypothetical protein ACKQPR_004900 [Serratia odorifera]|nr:hypothetical protein [Serratia odorifera]HEJ9097928.1 hypothetical protein [Serratia odorifera]